MLFSREDTVPDGPLMLPVGDWTNGGVALVRLPVLELDPLEKLLPNIWLPGSAPNLGKSNWKLVPAVYD
jgi:hypothetical protein